MLGFFLAGAFAAGALLAGVFVTDVVTGATVSLEVAGVDGVPVVEEIPLPEPPEPADPAAVCAALAMLVTVVDELPDEDAADDEALWLFTITPASSNGLRVLLVGVVCRFGVGACRDWEEDAGALGVVVVAGGAATSAFARWPCSKSGTATMARTTTITSGQSRRSNRSRLSDVILRPPGSLRHWSVQPSAGTGWR